MDLVLGKGSTIRDKGERLCSLVSVAVGVAEIAQVDYVEEQEKSQGQSSGISSVKQGWKKRSQRGARGGLAERRRGPGEESLGDIRRKKFQERQTGQQCKGNSRIK